MTPTIPRYLTAWPAVQDCPPAAQLARFIHCQSSRRAFMNSVELSKAAGVSNPTVIRLAYRLGFSGFPEFQKALQKAAEKKIDSLERFSGDAASGEEELFQKVLSLEFHVLREMKERLSEEAVSRAVALLENPGEVFVVGLLANTCLAEYLAYFLSILRENVHVLKDFGHEAYGKVRAAEPGAVAVIYSFPRYPAGTQSLGKLFASRGFPVIDTDSGMSPCSPGRCPPGSPDEVDHLHRSLRRGICDDPRPAYGVLHEKSGENATKTERV